MHDKLLTLFPAFTHPLTLVSDSDGLLADETLLTALDRRGFAILTDNDPVMLRHRIDEFKPWRVETPIIVITPGPLDFLPYDLWQAGYKLQISLHDYFPNLSYPLIHALTPYQRSRLNDATLPPTRLGQQATADYLLRHVFGLTIKHLAYPAALIAWLDDYHNGLAPLPPVLMEDLLARLEKLPAYEGWPIKALLQNRDAFSDFLQTQWGHYVQKSIGELSPSSQYHTGPPPGILLSFDKDTALQDTLPRLIRSGTLDPIKVADLSTLPAWAKPAMLTSQSDRLPRRMAELTAELGEWLDRLTEFNRWEDWQAIAHVLGRTDPATRRRVRPAACLR